jgi:hypothetical protein
MYAVPMQVSKNNGRIVAWNYWMLKQMCGSLIGQCSGWQLHDITHDVMQ